MSITTGQHETGLGQRKAVSTNACDTNASEVTMVASNRYDGREGSTRSKKGISSNGTEYALDLIDACSERSAATCSWTLWNPWTLVKHVVAPWVRRYTGACDFF